MNKSTWPKAFLVDLDNTLHDYRKAAQVARSALAVKIEETHGVGREAVLKRYEALMAEEKDVVAPSAQDMRLARIAKLLSSWPSTRGAAPGSFIALLEQTLLDALRPFAGALSAFAELQARARTIIVTEGYADTQQAIVRRLGLPVAPGDLLATHAHGVRKRDGGAYRLVREQLGFACEDIVMVGDNWPWDILASAGVGMWQVWVRGNEPESYRPPQRYLGSVQHFRAVPEFMTECTRDASRRSGRHRTINGASVQIGGIAGQGRARRAEPDRASLPPLPSDWMRYAMTDHAQSVVAALKDGIEAEAARTMAESTLHREYGVSCVRMVGSTCRGTSAELPVDFDLAVLTEKDQREIPHDVLRTACTELVTSLSRLPDFGNYCGSIAAISGVAPESARIELDSLGVRGTASLVARYDLIMRRADQTFRCGFLDVTCGRLPHLLGYERWMNLHFDELGPKWADCLRIQIRLAKAVLSQLDGVYGSKGRGLRGHAVEQLVIQSRNYRSSLLPIGTFDNAMRLIFEQGAQPGGRCFNEFKRAFPLWRPGGYDHKGQPVNLWHLLGDGQTRAAEERWHRLVSLAVGYQRRASDGRSWSIEQLTGFARAHH